MFLLLATIFNCMFNLFNNNIVRRYPAQRITDTDYANDTALLANTPAQVEIRLHSLKRAAVGIGLHVNTHKRNICALIKESTSPHYTVVL